MEQIPTEVMEKIKQAAKDAFPEGGNFALLRQQGFIAGATYAASLCEGKEKEIAELKEVHHANFRNMTEKCNNYHDEVESYKKVISSQDSEIESLKQGISELEAEKERLKKSLEFRISRS